MNTAGKALRSVVPSGWRVESQGSHANSMAFAYDPSKSEREANSLEVRNDYGDGWAAAITGWNEQRGMSDLIESKDGFQSAEMAAKAAWDLYKKHVSPGQKPGGYWRQRNYSQMEPDATKDPEFDFGGGLF